MRNYILKWEKYFDFGQFFATIAVTSAIAIVVYSVLFGG